MTAMSTSAIGRHSELIALTALLANGYTVLEPAVPEPFDLAFTRKGDREITRAQVKTAIYREKDGITYYVMRGKRNNGRVYDYDDCDVFIAVIGDQAYMFDNRAISEYWIRADELDERWERLPTRLDPADDFTLTDNAV